MRHATKNVRRKRQISEGEILSRHRTVSNTRIEGTGREKRRHLTGRNNTSGKFADLLPIRFGILCVLQNFGFRFSEYHLYNYVLGKDVICTH